MTDNLPTVVTMSTDPVRFAEVAGNLHNLAKALAGSTLVPKAFQGRPDDITAAWLLGMELDLPPMTSLLNVHVIEGRASLSANAMRGVAISKGVVFEIDEQTDTRVVMRAKGPGQTKWTPSVWTMDRAKKMGLDQKSNWKRMPQAMLVARATSELCRLVASNALMGMPYSTEELTDEIDVAEVPAAVTTKRRRAEPVRAETPEPELVPETVAGYRPTGTYNTADVPEERRVIGPPPPDDGEKIGANTRVAIMAGFGDLGIKDRNERLAKVSAVVGREIHSVNMLTEVEGRAVVRKLAQVRGESSYDQAHEEWPEPAEVPGS
jgi:hypothetical protein